MFIHVTLFISAFKLTIYSVEQIDFLTFPNCTCIRERG